MDLNIKITKIERTPDDKNVVIFSINGAPTTSLSLADPDMASLNALQNAIKQKLKGKTYEGQEFTVTI